MDHRDPYILEFFKCVTSNEDKKIAEMLEAKQVNVNERDESNENRTALHVAVLMGHRNLVWMLVDDYHADIDIVDKQGMAPIHVAAASYHVDLVKYFVSKNSIYKDDVSEILNDKEVDEFFNAVDANDVETVVALLNAGVDVNAMDLSNYRRRAVHVAATNGHLDLLKKLVDEYRANINVEDEIGELPMHNAIDNGHTEIAKFLAEKQKEAVGEGEGEGGGGVVGALMP